MLAHMDAHPAADAKTVSIRTRTATNSPSRPPPPSLDASPSTPTPTTGAATLMAPTLESDYFPYCPA